MSIYTVFPDALCPLGQSVEMDIDAVDIEVEPELRELYGYLAIEVMARDLIDELEIVVRDLVRFIDPRHVLAKAGKESTDADRLE